MHRYRAFLFVAFATVLVLIPHVTFAAGFFGPIVPDACVACPNGAAWGCVMATVGSVIKLMLSVAIILATLLIIYAGFLWATNAANPDNRTHARKVLMNALIGLVLALGAWIIVNTILVTLTGTGVEETTSRLGSGDRCLPVAVAPVGSQPTGNINGVGGQVGKAGALCSDGNTACSPSALQSAGLTDAQAQAMSCIAVTESSGNPNTPDSNTGACGTFQITNRPGNWANPKYHQGSCSVNSSCNDAGCNMQTAVLMFRSSGYQPWTGTRPDGTHWNPNAVACVAKYDPGH